MVYLLCFDRKYRHARHYIGFTESQDSFEKRLECHKKGRGARLMDAITKAGIGFRVARTWPDGDRNFERKLKNRKNAAKLCPHCKTEAIVAQRNAMLDDKPVLACPVIEVAKKYPILTQEKPIPDGTFVARMGGQTVIGDVYAKPQGNTNSGRWERIRNYLARFWPFQTLGSVSKQSASGNEKSTNIS